MTNEKQRETELTNNKMFPQKKIKVGLNIDHSQKLAYWPTLTGRVMKYMFFSISQDR